MALVDYNIEEFQLAQYSRQREFSAGQNNVADPLYLPENTYAFGKNLEIRDGKAKTRRGFKFHTNFLRFVRVGDPDAPFTPPLVQVPTPMFVPSTNPPQGAASFLHPTFGKILVLVIDRTVQFLKDGASPVILSSPTINTTEEVLVVSANGRIYILLGDGSPALRWDGFGPVTAVTDPSPPLFGIPRDSIIATYFQNRFWVKTGIDAIAASDILDPETFDFTTANVRISGGDSEEIVQIAAWRNKDLVIFKDESTHVLSSTISDLLTTPLPGNADVDLINRQGAVSSSVVEVGQDFWYFSRRGVETLVRNAQDRAIGVDLPISFTIEKTIEKINFRAAGTIKFANFDNLVLVAVPTTGDVPDTLLPYDLTRKAWLGEWSDWDVARWSIIRHFGEDRLAFFQNAGNLFRALEGFTDNSAEIETELQTRFFFIDPEEENDQRNLEIIVEHCAPSITIFSKGLAEREEEEIERSFEPCITKDRFINIEKKIWYDDAVLADSPTFYYRLSEQFGTIATDSSTGNNTAIYQNSPTFCEPSLISSDDNFSLRLNGTNQFVQALDGSFVNTGTGEITLKAWIKMDSVADYGVIAWEPPSATSNALLSVFQTTLFANFVFSLTTTVSLTGTTVLEAGRTYHIAVTVKSGDRIRLYLDGVEEANAAAPVFTTFLTPTAPLFIGSRNNAFFFDGIIDEAAGYETALSAAKIKTHFDAAIGTTSVLNVKDDHPFIPGETSTFPTIINEQTVRKLHYGHHKFRDLAYQLRIINKTGTLGVRQILFRKHPTATGRRDF